MNHAMKIHLLFMLMFLCLDNTHAQHIESIRFNLYADSLKKNVNNYINVEGKLSNGKSYPLDNSSIIFKSNYGKWEGNDLIIDSSYHADSVVVFVALKSNNAINAQKTIYLKKLPDPEVLKTVEEVLGEQPPKKQKSKKGS